MRDSISPSILKALVEGTVLTAVFAIAAAILPDYGWVFGVLLSMIGISSLAKELQECGKGTEEGFYSVLGLISLVFGVVIIFATIETVLVLWAVAVVVDAVVAVIKAIE